MSCSEHALLAMCYFAPLGAADCILTLYLFMCAGHHLQAAARHPVRLQQPSKVVYSPHVFGPSLEQQLYLRDVAWIRPFPASVAVLWDAQWNFLSTGPQEVARS